MQHKFFAEYYERLETLHQEMREAIQGLTLEALDWVPMRDSNSLAVLVVHTMGAERFWICDVAGQERHERDRDAEFRTKGVELPALLQLIDEIQQDNFRALEKMTLADLDQPRPSWRHSDELFIAAWALNHALEHTGLHLGHMQITRQWWDQRS